MRTPSVTHLLEPAAHLRDALFEFPALLLGQDRLDPVVLFGERAVHRPAQLFGEQAELRLGLLDDPLYLSALVPLPEVGS